MKNILVSKCLLGYPCRYDGKSVTGVDISRLREKYNLIPVCPEIYGGLETPRIPSEIVGDKVIMKSGKDVTENYLRGAEAALMLCKSFDCKLALLKERSPSCGTKEVYDGTFSKTLRRGMGVTAKLLAENGIAVFGEGDIEKLLS